MAKLTQFVFDVYKNGHFYRQVKYSSYTYSAVEDLVKFLYGEEIKLIRTINH